MEAARLLRIAVILCQVIHPAFSSRDDKVDRRRVNIMHAKTGPNPAATNVADQFSSLVDEYWEWRLQDAPEFASSIDVHTYDDKVEAYSIDVIDKRKTAVDGYLLRLKQIPRAELVPSDQVSYDVLKDTLETYLAGYRWRYYGPMNPINFLEGLWNDPKANMPDSLKTETQFTNFLLRLDGWTNQVSQMISRMGRAIKEKTTNNWVSMVDAVNQIDALIGNSTEENVFYQAIQEALDNSTLSRNKRIQLMTQTNATLVLLRTSYERLNLFIVKEYKNETRAAYGVNSFFDGAEYYKACLRWHLSTDQTPEEVHQLGLREVERILGEMTKVMDRLGFKGTVKEFFSMLNTNSSFFLSPEQTINRFRDIIFNRVKPKLSKFFKNIPNMPVKVEPQPNDGPGGMYMSGSPDGSRPGVFYANVKKPEYNPTYGMVALALHEADPGHHLQDIYAQSSPGLKMFRKTADYTKYFSAPTHFPFYTAYVEGWALYAESLGEKDQLDIYQDDYELMGRYSSEIFRACRLVVDTGLHYYNWSRREGIGYMLNYTAESEDAMTIEIDRYITWPGQACAYKVGELKIKELRARAETALGLQFDIQEFHSVVLHNGAVPLSVLEQIIDDWIARQQASWSMWSMWSDCSASCGGGVTVRVRLCGQGGTDCPGKAFDTNTCGTNGCPVDGKWSAWRAWSSCTHTCGSNAVRSRTRSCDSPAPQNGGASCSGPAYEVQPCNVSVCVIDGGWVDWSTWTTCDVTCGNGSQTRIRTCTNPVPRNGGKLCTGSTVDIKACVEGGCPVACVNGDLRPKQGTGCRSLQRCMRGLWSAVYFNCPTNLLFNRITKSCVDNRTIDVRTCSPAGHSVSATTIKPSSTWKSFKQTTATPTTTQVTTIKTPTTIPTTTTTSTTTPTTRTPTKTTATTRIPTSTSATTPTTTTMSSTTRTTTTNTKEPAVSTHQSAAGEMSIVSSNVCQSPTTIFHLTNHVTSHNISSSSCDSGDNAGSEALVLNHCDVDLPTSWTRGKNVMSLCNRQSHQRVPIATFYDGYYSAGLDVAAIFLGCNQRQVLIGIQMCTGGTRTEHLTQNGVGFKNAALYFVIQ